MARAGVSPLEVGRWTPAQSQAWISAYMEREKIMDRRMAWVVATMHNLSPFRGRNSITVNQLLGIEDPGISDDEYDRIKANIETRKKSNG